MSKKASQVVALPLVASGHRPAARNMSSSHTYSAAASAPSQPPAWSGLRKLDRLSVSRGNNICSKSLPTVEMSPIGL